MPRNSIMKSSQNYEPYSQSSLQSQITERDLKDQVNKCVIKILSDNHLLQPIKRSVLLCNTKVKGRAAQQLIEEVKKELFNIYGLELLENDNKFLLINPKNKILEEFLPKTTSPKYVFLGIVLALIIHNKDEIDAEELKKFFSQVSVDLERPDLYFGNVKKLMTKLEQQQYLDKIITPIPSEPSKVVYKWGLRSQYEVKKKDLLPIISLIYGISPEELPRPLIHLYSNDSTSSS